MKKGFTENNLPPIIFDNIGTKKWSLCIGAGTSKPLFPTWNELVYELILEVNRSTPKSLVDKLLLAYKPDAIIQAVFNRLNLSYDEYINLLSTKLYQNIKSVLTDNEWNSFKICLSSETTNVSDEAFADFDDIIRKPSLQSSALFMGEVLAQTIGTSLEPNAIVSFNTESLLFAIIHHYIHKKNRDQRKYLDFINRSISPRDKRRVPYIFCHGTLPVPETSNYLRERRISNGKLVFLENEYLQLANNSFSWQSNSFLEIVNSNIVVFVGVSLSDPNMRRWLSWSHNIRIEEICSITKKSQIDSAKHYWINKDPCDVEQKSWIEANVAHLGVRLIWISDWKNIGIVLKKMLNMK